MNHYYKSTTVSGEEGFDTSTAEGKGGPERWTVWQLTGGNQGKMRWNTSSMSVRGVRKTTGAVLRSRYSESLHCGSFVYTLRESVIMHADRISAPLHFRQLAL